MITELITELRALVSHHAFNPYTDQARDDRDALEGPADRVKRLVEWLGARPSPRYLFVGEAPGWRGARMTGIPFTSEVQLGYRVSTAVRPYAEATATVFWSALGAANLAEKVVAWNAFPLHPHRPDWYDSNRTPTNDEIRLGRRALEILIEGYHGVQIVAVGRKAETALDLIKCHPRHVLRHPAQGGAAEFRKGVEALARKSR